MKPCPLMRWLAVTLWALAWMSVAAAFPERLSAEPWKRHCIDDSSRGADGVRVADVNGDSLLDLTTGWEEGGIVRVYINPGPDAAKQAWPAVTVGRVRSPEDAVFVDLDADGATDVVSCCEGNQRTMFVHWAPRDPRKYLEASAWKTEAIPCTERQQPWMYCLPRQVDGQHGVDLIVGSKGSDAMVGWLKAPADARHLSGWTLQKACSAGWIMSLEPADVDGDGHEEIVVSDRKGKQRGVYWLGWDGLSKAELLGEWPRHPIGGQGREVMFLDVVHASDRAADKLELPIRPNDVAVAVKPAAVEFYQRSPDNADQWSARREFSFAKRFGTAKAVRVVDINQDGQIDAVCSCETANGDKSGVFWFTPEQSIAADGAGEATTFHDISGPRGVKFDLIQTIDLDDDGDLDVVTCEERDNLGLIWYENPVVAR